MWAPFVLAAASLVNGQDGGLALTNVRTTYGAPGIVREDNKLLPGDHVYVSFDIEGITVSADGKVQYSMATEVLDGSGKSLFREDPRDLEVVNGLGGRTVPAYTQMDVGVNAKPGKYTLKTTVTDRASKRSQSLSREFEVQPKQFGLVRLTTTLDHDARVPAASFATGETLWVNCSAVDFQRSDKQPKVAVELRVMDESDKPVLSQPFKGVVDKDVPETALSVPVQFLIPLNRAGKFKVELKATDQLSGKTAELKFPITVQQSK
ncbi:MAG TPA: hypothetical protein VKE94_11495 [Gemmataceae bacterium]|nr:hypothetical protein [Gemmataceae bacterium]